MKRLVVILPLLFGGAGLAQDYVGDASCRNCHMSKYNDYMESGHPWKIYQTAGEVPAPDTWPFTAVPPLPMAFGEQLEWSDVEYTIGNFFWKTRFIDREGFIWTGDANDSTQWNIATQEFVPYHPGEERPFNCGRCHTTGYDPEGNQNDLPGLIGTWAQDGVRCEACHGPASLHVAGSGDPLPPGGKDCSECHFRDAEFRMPWQNGFMRHHQQSEDFSHSPHRNFEDDCKTCHNPHRSTVYELGGMTTYCRQCHPGDADNSYYRVQGMQSIECSNCHMPFMGKSATNSNQFTGDIRGHLFQIMTDPVAAEDNVTDGFWNQDENGDGFITLDYACLGCHIDIGMELTLEQASAFAQNIHVDHAAIPGDVNGDGIVGFQDILPILAGWGPCDDCDGCPEDMNGDCLIGFQDVLFVLSNWT